MNPSQESINEFTKYNAPETAKKEALDLDIASLWEAVKLLEKEFAAWQAKQSWHELEIADTETKLMEIGDDKESEKEIRQQLDQLKRELEEIKKAKLQCSKKIAAFKSTPAYQEEVLKIFRPHGPEN